MLWSFLRLRGFLLLMLLCNANCDACDEADCNAEVLCGFFCFELPATLLRILAVTVVEGCGHAQRRDYPSLRRIKIA